MVAAQETQTATHADRYRAAASEFARRLTDALGDRVDSIVLYGSTARGDAEIRQAVRNARAFVSAIRHSLDPPR